MDLKLVVSKLNKFAPLSLAASWDNVGLLIQPSGQKLVSRVFLTNDLTEPVMAEAVANNSDLIISYHPPIFSPLKRVTARSWKERIVVECLEKRIALYSPHTAWDAIQGGINDWLVLPYGAGTSVPVDPSISTDYPGGNSHTITITNTPVSTEELQPLLSHPHIVINIDSNAVNIGCSGSQVSGVLSRLPSSLLDSVRITKHEAPPLPNTGAGRKLTLDTPLSLSEAVSRTKTHLGLTGLRLAVANGASLDSLVKTVAVCAGSGGSVIGRESADLLVTGEMSHHEVLDCVHRGSSVILTDHSNTERGFHTHVREKLLALLGEEVDILVSTVDRDPLTIV